MRRVISIWLPRWPIDRLRRSQARQRSRSGGTIPPVTASVPFAVIAPDRRGPVLWAVDRAAGKAGLHRGMRLADARALCAGLVTAPANQAADSRDLEQLALWCNRFAPCCAVDGRDGLVLDITGCAHLFGGEASFMEEITRRLADLAIKARLGLADTPGAARALARFSPPGSNQEMRIARPGGSLDAVAGLPVEALGITTADARLLRRLGIVTIGALVDLPRPALSRRFPCRDREEGVLLRLDRTLGRCVEPITPAVPLPICMERSAFPEPLLDRNGLELALGKLMARLTASLERNGLGVRHLAFWCYRVDGDAVRCTVSTARASRDGMHLLRLFRDRLDTVDPGFGIDCAALHAVRAEPLESVQLQLTANPGAGGDVNLLIDRLQARLGNGTVCRLEPADRHRPEDAERRVAPGREPATHAWSGTAGKPQRPFRLFDRPEPVDAVADAADSPPSSFAWRGSLRRICRAAGPERIEPEWWKGARAGPPRDYYDVEDAEGRRYWLYRAGFPNPADCREEPRWYLHGLYR